MFEVSWTSGAPEGPEPDSDMPSNSEEQVAGAGQSQQVRSAEMGGGKGQRGAAQEGVGRPRDPAP